MKQIRVERSFVAADALAEVIAEEYGFVGDVRCKLFSKMLRTQDNDHYLVTVGNERYVARIYQIGRFLQREPGEYQFEVDWLDFLSKRGHPVSHPVRRPDNSLLGSVLAPEGERFYALFSYAAGESMDHTDADLLFKVGAAMARIHLDSHNFKPQSYRKPWDFESLVDRPVRRIKRNWQSKEREDDVALLIASADEARDRIRELLGEERTPDRWGVIGGDFHSTNTLVDDEGNITFINFDLCGYGWFAYDIAVFLMNTNLLKSPVELSEAFFAGYFSERPLSPEEHESISDFLNLRRVWLTGSFAMAGGFAGTTFIAPA